MDVVDFKHNTNLWRKICLLAKSSIESGEIGDEDAINLVMPVLLSEIERGGNYTGAFSTICNIGRSVIEVIPQIRELGIGSQASSLRVPT